MGEEEKVLICACVRIPSSVQMMRQIGAGLAALHDRGIVHRDMKPHNVLVTEGGQTKLSDMGLSKRLTLEQSSFESFGPGRVSPHC